MFLVFERGCLVLFFQIINTIRWDLNNIGWFRNDHAIACKSGKQHKIDITCETT